MEGGPPWGYNECTKGLKIGRKIDGEGLMSVIPHSTERLQRTDLIAPLLQHFGVADKVGLVHSLDFALAEVCCTECDSKHTMDIVACAAVLGHNPFDNL